MCRRRRRKGMTWRAIPPNPGRSAADRPAGAGRRHRHRGQGLGATGSAVGEVCFNTAMTGYQEILTDPSYAGQIITFTFPHIGNVGANREDTETANLACARACAAACCAPMSPSRPTIAPPSISISG